MNADDPRRFSPAAERNKAPILAALLERLPARGDALEVASGSGQHVLHFAAALPGWQWQPTDAEPAALASIAAHCADRALRNVAPPRRLVLPDDAGRPALPDWLGRFDLVYCANLIHIAPWGCCVALMQLANGCLRPGGRLCLYGPFLVDGESIPAGNRAFDADLRARNPDWGVRWLHAVEAQARAAGMDAAARTVLPANNLLLEFRPRLAADPADPAATR